MNQSIKEIVIATWKNLRDGLVAFLPGFIAALFIILIGWLVAFLLSRIIRRVLRVARFDRFAGNVGLTHLLSKADIRTEPSHLMGKIIFWLVFLLFVAAGFNAMGLEMFKRLTSELVLYLPNVIAGVLILLLGAFASSFLSRAALLAAVNAGIPSPRVIGLVVRGLILILAFAMGMEQLKIASSIVTAAFTIAFGAVMLGLAIAFGLGGRDLARRAMEKSLLDHPSEKNDRFQHL